MRWHDLLFLHWPIRPELIRPLIPRDLELDTFDGCAGIGVVPFRMTGVRPRYLPVAFGFPELNVRTYVMTPGKSGVWFFSLDAASWDCGQSRAIMVPAAVLRCTNDSRVGAGYGTLPKRTRR